MARLIPPGSEKKRFYTAKVFPGMVGGMIVVGFIMLLTSGIVLGWKNYHFKVTRGENKRPFEWYLGAGVCITAASIASFIVIKRADSPLVKKCSLVYIIILALATIFTLVAVITSFTLELDDMENDMKINIQDYGLGRKKEETMNINTLQSEEDCCGVNYYTDWRNTKFGGRRIFAVPDTCCKTNEFGCGFKFETEDINRRGCLEVVKGSVGKRLLVVKIMGFFILFVEVGVVVATAIIWKKYMSEW